ncbi:hypothetical protein MKW98_030161 [Papaver atlanticum]|uniref:SWIM-type domain-containing protein n=1 Tax=Papaver atlanticum TaxID=357466 RepID=A0AAD4XKT0_9MAGN|nr:hypothetical protein MKW98_030161 [Papaver atlanticum]
MVADWNKCEDDMYFSEGYTSSENSTIPSDAEEEEDIPRLPRRRLNFANGVAGENLNVADEDAGVAWVTSIVLTYMKERLRTKPPIIRKMVLKKKKVKISYWIALRARHMCLEKIHGSCSYERSFRLVPELCHQIKANNPGTIAELNKPIMFFSDHEKGVNVAVTENFEGIEHNQRSCFRHIFHRMAQKFPGLDKVAWKLSESFNFNSFNAAMEELGRTNMEAKLWMEKHETSTWARHAFDHSVRCPLSFNIISLAFQNWLKELNCKPIITLVMEYENKLGDLMFKRRYAEMKHDGIVPRAEMNVETKKFFSSKYDVLPADVGEEWSVTHRSKAISTFQVNLTRRHCSCGEWAATGVPCVHVLAVLVHEGREDYNTFVDDFFTVERYRVAYDGIIQSLPDIDQWRKHPNPIVHPPPMIHMPN